MTAETREPNDRIVSLPLQVYREIPTTSDPTLAPELRDGNNAMWIYPRGNPTVKVVPLPGRLCTSIVPPCASAIHLQMARPSPAPGRSPVRVRAESARQKRSKM